MKKLETEVKKNFAIKLALITWGIIAVLFLGDLIRGTYNYSNVVMGIKFIKTINILLGLTAVATCYIVHKKLNDSTIFVVMLMILCLLVSIVFGFVDYKFFNELTFTGTNYLFLSILPLKLYLMWAVIFRGRAYKFINRNRILSTLIIILITILLGFIDGKVGNNINTERRNYYTICGGVLSLGYLICGIKLFIDSVRKSKIIYAFLGVSLIILGAKCFYLCYMIDYSSFNMKLMAVLLTYISFFIIIIGVGVELYSLNEENILLNNKLTKFYNLVENNKNANILICDANFSISYMNKHLKDEVVKQGGIDSFEKYLMTRKIKNIKSNEIEDTLNETGLWVGILHNEEKCKVYECSAQEINEEGRNIEYLISYTDISKAIELENEIREMKINSSKEAIFISNLSHELKTPLNIFSSSIQLLDACKDNDNFKDMYEKYSNALRINTRRMLRLINNIIDTTKINLDALAPDFKNYEIVSLVEDIVLSTINYGKTKGIYLEFDTELEEHYIKCDAYMVEKILLNLISNGIKYSKENTTLNVNLYFSKKFVEIHVKDRGVGIKEEDKEWIYDRFSRCDNSLKRMSEGSGIGLSLVKALVNCLNGEIEVESKLGVGSTFKVKLPNVILEEEILQLYKFNESTTELELSDIY